MYYKVSTKSLRNLFLLLLAYLFYLDYIKIGANKLKPLNSFQDL